MARLRELAHSTIDALTDANMQLQRIPAEATSLAKVLSGLHDPGYFDDRDLAEHVRGHLDHADLGRWSAAAGAARHEVDELVGKLEHAVGSAHGPLGQAGQELLADARSLALSQQMFQTALRNVDAAVTSSGEPGGVDRLTSAIQDLRIAELAVRQSSEQVKVDLAAVDAAPEPEHHHTHTAHHDQPSTHSTGAVHGTSAPGPTDPGPPTAGPGGASPGEGLPHVVPDKVAGETSPGDRLEGDLARLVKEGRDAAGDVAGTVAGRVVKEAADKVNDVAEVVHKVGQHNESMLGVVRDIGQDTSAVGRQEVAVGEQQVAQGGLVGTVAGYTNMVAGTVVEAVGEGVHAVGAAGAALAHGVAGAGAWGEAQGHRLEAAAGEVSEGIRHAANNPIGEHEVDLATGPGKPVIQPPSDPAHGDAVKSSAGASEPTSASHPKAEAGAEFAAPVAGAAFAAPVPGAEFAGEAPAASTPGAEAGAEFAIPDPAPAPAGTGAPQSFDDNYSAGQPT